MSKTANVYTLKKGIELLAERDRIWDDYDQSLEMVQKITNSLDKAKKSGPVNFKPPSASLQSLRGKGYDNELGKADAALSEMEKIRNKVLAHRKDISNKKRKVERKMTNLGIFFVMLFALGIYAVYVIKAGL